jgi:hypothetical protein
VVVDVLLNGGKGVAKSGGLFDATTKALGW